MAQYPHLIIPPGPDPVRFTSPNTARPDPFNVPRRNRRQHAERLIAKLELLEPEVQRKVADQKTFGLDDGLGTDLTFSSERDFALKFESLDVSRSGIELCAVKSTEDNRQLATVFVPDGKLEIFLNKIRAYRDEQTTPRSERGISLPRIRIWSKVFRTFNWPHWRLFGRNITFHSRPQTRSGHGKCGYENLMVGINWNVSVRTHLGLNCSLVIKAFHLWTAKVVLGASERSEAVSFSRDSRHDRRAP